MTAPIRTMQAGLAAALFLAIMRATMAQENPPEAAPAPEAAQPPAAPPPAARLPETPNEAVGTWDIAIEGANRRCTLTLAGESGGSGRVLRFPAGCRRALPILARVDGWLYADKGIRLVDRNIRPLLAFEPGSEPTSLGAKAESGERYTLVPVDIAVSGSDGAQEALGAAPPPGMPPVDLSPAATPIPATNQARNIPGAQPALPADRLSPPEVAPGDRPGAGTYALDRFNNKDVCRLALDPRPASPAETSLLKPTAITQPTSEAAAARILPGCRDNGITVFDPVSWNFANGRLTLKSRRGHAVNLIFTGEGIWRRDPDVGTTLELRRVEP